MRRVLLLSAMMALIPACGGGGGSGGSSVVVNPPPANNQAPSVSLVLPAPGTTVAEGSSVALRAEASDPDGGVAAVQFFDGTSVLGTVNAAPFDTTWVASRAGAHSLHAVATDSSGATTASAGVGITVMAGSPLPTSAPEGRLYGVFFADETHGWVVGENGGAWATTNGGTSWSRQSVPTPNALSRVQFLNTATGWTVGGFGEIFKTTDGGLHWTAQTSGISSFLRGLSFVDENNGWVVGADGAILKTTNGGATWTSASAPSGFQWRAIAFITPDKGWVGGDGILSTSDGGVTWTHTATFVHSDSGFDHPAILDDARFASPTLGMMSGGYAGGSLWYTTRDGGLNWTLTLGSDLGSLSGIAFGDAAHWWAVGTFGTIQASSDSGRTWSVQSGSGIGVLSGVWFVNASTGWAVGDSGLVLRTTDGGRTWVVLAHRT